MASPFFARRFGSINFSIFTPKGCARRDMCKLTFSPSASRKRGPFVRRNRRLLAVVLQIDLQSASPQGKDYEAGTGQALADAALGEADPRTDQACRRITPRLSLGASPANNKKRPLLSRRQRRSAHPSENLFCLD